MRGSDWWYEGRRLYPHVVLEKLPRVAHIAHIGVVCKSKVMVASATIATAGISSSLSSPPPSLLYSCSRLRGDSPPSTSSIFPLVGPAKEEST